MGQHGSTSCAVQSFVDPLVHFGHHIGDQFDAAFKQPQNLPFALFAMPHHAAHEALAHPRLENADYMMIMGSGGTVDAAMKAATTEMSRWLADTYGLTPQDISQSLAMLSDFIDKTISLHPEASYGQEQFDIVLL